MEVLVENVDEEGFVARSPHDAPEIDGLVYVAGASALKTGDFAQVRIIDSDEHDLWGELA
jgi:ribosomal protein S12 methylthiotransferase